MGKIVNGFHVGGRKPVKRNYKMVSLSDFLPKAADWPAVAPRGWEYNPDIGAVEMLGNDQWGDCGEAGAMHLIQVETANSGKPLYGTLEQTLALYSTVTGFDINAGPSGNNPTDQGTALTDLLTYWQKTGITVTDRKTGAEVVHQIVGWAALDVSSIAQLRYANDVFGGLYKGINCPASALQDTSDWPFVLNSPIEGGHCINQTGQGSSGGHIQSWGLNIPFTWEFDQNYLEEAYVVVTPWWLSQQGKSPSGLDLDALLSAMKAFASQS